MFQNLNADFLMNSKSTVKIGFSINQYSASKSPFPVPYLLASKWTTTTKHLNKMEEKEIKVASILYLNIHWERIMFSCTVAGVYCVYEQVDIKMKDSPDQCL